MIRGGRHGLMLLVIRNKMLDVYWHPLLNKICICTLQGEKTFLYQSCYIESKITAQKEYSEFYDIVIKKHYPRCYLKKGI